MDDYLPPLPSLDFPVFGAATPRSGWRSLVGWSSPGSFHQITLAHGDGSLPVDGQRDVPGFITVTTDRQGLSELDPDTGLGRPATEQRPVMSSAFVYLIDRVTRSWTGSDRACRSWINGFCASNTDSRDSEDWLPTTLVVDGQGQPGLVRSARGQAVVIAEVGSVFITAGCDESILGQLQLAEVSADIDDYVAGRAALTAAKPGSTA